MYKQLYYQYVVNEEGFVWAIFSQETPVEINALPFELVDKIKLGKITKVELEAMINAK